MNIIVGHSNMDLDCIGSIVLARYLYPGYIPVKSRLIHPVAKNLQNLYQNHLAFANPMDLEGQNIENMIVVDTRTSGRIEEYTRYIGNTDVRIEVYDHHPADDKDIAGAVIHEKNYGANTTQLGEEVMKRGIEVSAEDATIALAGIYADTGNFTHLNVCNEDFRVSSYLLSCGASLKLINHMLKPLRKKLQISLFHQVLNSIDYRTVRGHAVITSFTELEDESAGINAVVEKVFDVENAEVYFAFFNVPKRKKLLVVARNSKHNIRLNEILSEYGGGGHEQAASAVIKTEDARSVYDQILGYMERMFEPAVTAADIMTEDVQCISSEVSLLQASLFLEEVSHTGVPVLAPDGKLAGFLTLRDIMKGRRAEQMNSPVKGYMTRKVITAGSGTTVREIDELLFENNIGHLPIVDDGKLAGIVTRNDYLSFRKSEQKRRRSAMTDIGLLKEAE